jgi:hypothetical protein
MQGLYIVPVWCHPKNTSSLKRQIKLLNIPLVNSIQGASHVYMPSYTPTINPAQFPNKKFILGPHFSVLPDEKVLSIDTSKNNVTYIMPSQSAKDVWLDYQFTHMPIKVCPFGVDTRTFAESPVQKTKILIYVKLRYQHELDGVLSFLFTEGYSMNDIEILVYGRYNEQDYITFLSRAKFCIWIGSTESQGFALQECLACNVPILVWNIRRFSQYQNDSQFITSEATSVPFWDASCGELFYTLEELPDAFQKLTNGIANIEYFPRQFILSNLSDEICGQIFSSIS